MPDSDVVKVIIYGRGGQGAKTAGELIAEAALMEGKFAQAFPEYGPERRGAPTRAFVKISKRQIRSHEPILSPDYVIVLDDTLLGGIDISNTVGIINTTKSEKAFRETHAIDASGISQKVMGKDIPNTVLAGSFAKVSGAVKLETLAKVTSKIFSKKYDNSVIDQNLELLKKGFDGVKKV